MRISTTAPSPGRTDNTPRRELTLAWVAAAVTVAAMAGVFIVSESAEAALWLVVPVLFVAAFTALVSGLAARRHGEERGVYPALLGAVVIGFYALMFMLALVGHLIGFE